MANPPLKALIVDDEPLARQELAYLLERAGGVSVVGEGTNGIEAVDLVRTHRPDVVFLDVRMPGLDGFAVLRKLLAVTPRIPLPQVVFATAFDQYAVRAFEVNAVDYLLKPFDGKRLAKTLEKLRSIASLPDCQEAAPQPPDPPSSIAAQIRSPKPETAFAVPPPASAVQFDPDGETHTDDANVPAASPHPPNPLDTAGRSRLWEAAQARFDALLRMVGEQALGAGAPLPVRTGRVVVRLGERLLLVDQKDVCFVSIEEGRISVVTKTLEGDSNVRTLDELADQLDPKDFWRAHRSFLVNLHHIREVLPWFKSTYKLRMDDRKGTEIPVSRTQTRRLRELFNL